MGTRWPVGTVLGLALMALLAGCGDSSMLTAEPTGRPYTGPLHLEPAEARSDVERKTGAASRVLACETRIVGGTSEPYTGEVRGDLEAILAEAFGQGAFDGPKRGYQLDRVEDDRALFTYRLHGQAKQAVIMRDGVTLDHGPGWFVESWARCNLSEFPQEVADGLGLEFLSDDTGRRVPTYEAQSLEGPQHCGWQHLRILTLADQAQYIRKADTKELPSYFAESYRGDAQLPGDAIDTGLNLRDDHLWLSSDRQRAYVGDRGARTVEMWPRPTQQFACA